MTSGLHGSYGMGRKRHTVVWTIGSDGVTRSQSRKQTSVRIAGCNTRVKMEWRVIAYQHCRGELKSRLCTYSPSRSGWVLAEKTRCSIIARGVFVGASRGVRFLQPQGMKGAVDRLDPYSI
jgi:hypothetical protein